MVIMKTTDTCLAINFTYVWTIENVPIKTYIDLKSPSFVVKSIGEAKWHLAITGDVDFVCLLKSTDSSRHIPRMNFEFSFLGADGSPLVTERLSDPMEYRTSLNMESFSNRWAEIVPGNTLTVRCRIWTSGLEIPVADLCYARTKLKTYEEAFTWAVDKFSALNSSNTEDFRELALDERKVYPLKPLSEEGPFMALIMYLNRDEESEGVCVDFLIEKCRDYAYSCEISILDANGEVIATEIDSCQANFPWEFLTLWHLISKDRLTTCKDLFLPNDTLLLKCSLQICTGVVSNEIEYCTPNVSPVFEPQVFKYCVSAMNADDSLMFEEYFIKEDDGIHTDIEDVQEKSVSDSWAFYSDSYTGCSDSCPLKGAMKYLYNEAF